MKVIIVGGVAGGASCAARLRRLDEKAEILMVERGPYVSYANCGLPYHVGGVIEKESSLLVANEQYVPRHVRDRLPDGLRGDRPSRRRRRPWSLRERRDRRGDHRVLRQARAVARGGFDPSAAARASTFPGIFQVRTVPDASGDPRVDRARHERSSPGWTTTRAFQMVRPVTRAVVVGGGFIGLEMAENLVHRGFDVTLIEMPDQVLAPLDPEIRAPRRGLHREARRAGRAQ